MIKIDAFTVKDFCYSSFGRLGKMLSSRFPTVDHDLESAFMKIHPEVYFSIISSIATVSCIIPFTVLMLYLSGFFSNIALPVSPNLLVIGSWLVPPALIMFGVIYPKLVSSTRMSNLEIEIPYASMYISVMVSGGLSPFESFIRMKDMELLPNMQNEVSRIQTTVMSTGMDPLSAMEQAGNAVDIKEYKELLLGYASSVRTGGDTLHYLFNQTKGMFRLLTTKVKAKGESAAMLMEAYTIIGILGVLGVFLMFVVGMSLPMAGISMSAGQFFMFSFIIMPFMSFMFIYFGELIQFNYPVHSYTQYYVVLAFLPIGLGFASQTVLPFFAPDYTLIPALPEFVTWVCKLLSLAEGTEPSIGLTLSLIVIGVPGWMADHYYAGRDGSLQAGITQFLRDLVEVRKSGLSPEKSIEALSGRDYKTFSRHLRDISTKISWGYPLRQIYGEFRSQVKNWLALVNVYLLIDTMEVGGGTEQSIESLAEFSEATEQLEAEKKAVLMPLMIVPYIGAALLTGTTVMFLSFFTSSDLGVSVPIVMLYKTLLTPLSLHTFSLGMVTGKITGGRVSAGFKHGILLSLVSIGGLWMISNMDLGGGMI